MPTSRATVISATPLASPGAWLAELDRDAEVASALAVLNRALRAHRAAAADPYVGEVSAERALVVRIGYGSGEEVADGRYGEALELPRFAGRRVKRSMEAPEERFAALLGGREEVHPAEELVLRARADLNAGRPAEAALQCRVAIEALLGPPRRFRGRRPHRTAPRGGGGGGQRGRARADRRRSRGRPRGRGRRDGAGAEAAPPGRLALKRGQHGPQLGRRRRRPASPRRRRRRASGPASRAPGGRRLRG